MVVGSLVVGPSGELPLPWLAEPLARALAGQRGHATLLHASPGVGALEFALALGMAWLCEAVRQRPPLARFQRLHGISQVSIVSQSRVRSRWL
jgi:hypothetical protein